MKIKLELVVEVKDETNVENIENTLSGLASRYANGVGYLNGIDNYEYGISHVDSDYTIRN